MLNTRTFSTSTLSVQTSARRRMRRSTAGRGLLCLTNGCATFLEPNGRGGARCPICGASARLP